MREQKEPEVIVRIPNEANAIDFLDQNKDIDSPVRISSCENIIDVRGFIEAQKRILLGGTNQAEYDRSIRRIRAFRKAINK